MVFLKYVGVFVGASLLVGFIAALIIGPYAGVIGFFAGTIAAIYYRGKRRIQAAEDEFVETFTDAYVAESKKPKSPSRQTVASPTIASTQQVRPSEANPNPSVNTGHQIGISNDKPESPPESALKSVRTTEQNRTLQKKDLLYFLSIIDWKAFEYATDIPTFGSSQSLKSTYINSVARRGSVDVKAIISRFQKDDLNRALNSIPKGQLSEIVDVVNEVLGKPKAPDLQEEEPQETVQPPTAPETSPLCLKCGHTNPVVAQHCISCGEKLPDLICPKCDTENIAEAKFCMGCGEER